jgi:nucleotide-binding universal stress UspA family protein
MRILLAVDGSAPSQAAIDDVASRPWPTPSNVRVISVVRPYVPPATEFVPGASAPDEILREHLKDAERTLTRVTERLARPGLSVETAVRQGDPRAVIVDEAAEWGADLVVVGSHGRTGLTRLLLGSVAQYVAAHAPCSVEVVRRRRPAGAGEG